MQTSQMSELGFRTGIVLLVIAIGGLTTNLINGAILESAGGLGRSEDNLRSLLPCWHYVCADRKNERHGLETACQLLDTFDPPAHYLVTQVLSAQASPSVANALVL